MNAIYWGMHGGCVSFKFGDLPKSQRPTRPFFNSQASWAILVLAVTGLFLGFYFGCGTSPSSVKPMFQRVVRTAFKRGMGVPEYIFPTNIQLQRKSFPTSQDLFWR